MATDLANPGIAAAQDLPVDTKERILDVAGHLFAERGFDGVSMRDLTREAEVNLAAVNYHFGGKEALISAVLSRHVRAINRERLARLDAAESAVDGQGVVELESVMDIFFRPALMHGHGSPGATDVFFRLAGRCLADEGEHVPESLADEFREAAQRFVAATRRCVPGLSAEDALWGLFFSGGTLIYLMSKSRFLTAISEGRCNVDDRETTMRRLVAYNVAGLRALAAKEPS